MRKRLDYAADAFCERPFWTLWLAGFLVFTLATGVTEALNGMLLALFQFSVAFGIAAILLWHLDGPRRTAIRVEAARKREEHLRDWHQRVEELDKTFFRPQGWQAVSSPYFGSAEPYYLALYPPRPTYSRPRALPAMRVPVIKVFTRDSHKADLALAQCIKHVMDAG